MKNFQKRACVLACLTLLSASVFSQLAPTTAALPYDFDYTRYDAASPALPDDYPAKHYSADVLLRRLVAIAEGPELTLQDIEREFGLRFVRPLDQGPQRWVARGRFPLGSDLSRYSNFRSDRAVGSVFLSLQLINSVRGAGGEQTDYGGQPKLCVDVINLYESLGAGWEKVTRGIGTHYPLSIYLVKTIDGRKRQVQVAPPSLGERVCVRSFTLTYGAE